MNNVRTPHPSIPHAGPSVPSRLLAGLRHAGRSAPSRLRAGLRHAGRSGFARRAIRVLLALGAVALLLGPLRGVLVLSMAVAVGVVVAFGVLGAVGALMVRRATRNLLQSQPHLQRLGHRYETTHDGVQVHGVERAPSGDLAMSLSWQSRHHIELDGEGVPLSVTDEGPGSTAWTLSGQQLPGDEELRVLQDLVGSELSLVEHGLVDVTGPRTTRRVLTSTNGVVLDLHG